jgi:hypothetical protein
VAQANTITVTIQASSALATAIAALSAGQSATFSGGTGSGIGINQFEWQARFHYDAVNGVCQAMGKDAAGQTNTWIHRTYNIATNSWSTPNFSGWGGNGTGHVYDNFTFDPATGDCYIVAGIGTNELQKYTRATNTWSTVLSNVFQPGPPAGYIDPINGVCWHPNLFGTGDGGVVMTAGTNGNDAGFVYWRKSTGARTQVNTSIDAGNQQGCGVFFANINKAIMGGQSSTSGGSNTANHVLITPNVAAGGTPTAASVGTPPIKTGGDSHLASNFGSVHQHPGDPTRMLLLERIGSGRRVWQSTDGDAWTLKAYTHPFSITSGITIASLYPLGALWAINASTSVLWKPND